jgi:hypothetical protein
MLEMLSAAIATFVGGNELYGQCLGTPSQQVACISYITGVADGIAASQTASDPAPYRVCIPIDQVDRRQLMDITVKFLREHPANRNLHASVLVFVALQNAFPCSER